MKKIFFLILLLPAISLQAQETADTTSLQDKLSNDSTINVQKHISFNGQITGWALVQFAQKTNTQFGSRFIPTLTGKWDISPKTKIDFEASAHLNGALNFSGLNYDTVTYTLKPYRVWLRYSGDNWEVRGGLQKINFGSAKMFRPLMWFDRMDVRDPMQITDGVYGVLGKYFFKNNANIWFWSLLGNKNPKGYELLGSGQWKPEVGGRIEIPAGPGEVALSTHFRKADLHSLIPFAPAVSYINEKRIGLDGKWDVGIGLWFENSISIFEKSQFPVALYNDMWNAGADYTVPVGSGLGVTLEYFRYHLGNKIWKEGQAANIIGSMFTYPISITDNASAMIFYVNEAKKFFNYVSYSRTYDNWNFYLIGFLNPEINLPIGGQMNSKNMFMGKGIQLMVNYNF